MLCANRFVLPVSFWLLALHEPVHDCIFNQGSPSTCTIDTVLVPLPSFLLVVFGTLVLLRRSRDNSRIVIPRWIHTAYMLLVIAAMGMWAVELARDIAANLGVGLIPAVLVGLTLVFVGLCFEFKGRSRSLSAVSTLFHQNSPA